MGERYIKSVLKIHSWLRIEFNSERFFRLRENVRSIFTVNARFESEFLPFCVFDGQRALKKVSSELWFSMSIIISSLLHIYLTIIGRERLRWSRGSVLAFSTQVRGFKPGRNRRIFKGRKNPQHAFLRRGSKAVGPMS